MIMMCVAALATFDTLMFEYTIGPSKIILILGV